MLFNAWNQIPQLQSGDEGELDSSFVNTTATWRYMRI
jgi:hypothetical protein